MYDLMRTYFLSFKLFDRIYMFVFRNYFTNFTFSFTKIPLTFIPSEFFAAICTNVNNHNLNNIIKGTELKLDMKTSSFTVFA
jgi:hypothetical protein